LTPNRPAVLYTIVHATRHDLYEPTVFVAGAVLAGASFVATLFLPPVDFSRSVAAAAGEQMLAAEMTNLEPEDEPVAVPER
jgi:hypothetical protein